MNKNKSKSKSIRQTKLITELCVCAVAVVSAVYVLKVTSDRTEKVPISPFIETSSSPDTDIAIVPEDPNKTIYESIAYPTVKKFEGDLILVNNDVEYYGYNEELVTVNYEIADEGREGFIGCDDEVELRPVFYTAMADLLEEFYYQTDISDVVIYDGYRTYEDQQYLYDDDLANTGLDYSERVALPGHSEHQTGYSADLSTSTNWDYDGQGDYAWIDQNCWKYGIILRYPEDKTEITQIQYEPWHYRYVGVPHATYITENNLALEEYIELLRNYTYEGEHLEIQYATNKCEVYFVPSDDANETTYIPVPSGKMYEISGNNVDGFIVTVYPDIDADVNPLSTESVSDTTEESYDEESSEDEYYDESSDDEYYEE